MHYINLDLINTYRGLTHRCDVLQCA